MTEFPNTPETLAACDLIRAAHGKPDLRETPEVLAAWATLIAARDAFMADVKAEIDGPR